MIEKTTVPKDQIKASRESVKNENGTEVGFTELARYSGWTAYRRVMYGVYAYVGVYPTREAATTAILEK